MRPARRIAPVALALIGGLALVLVAVGCGGGGKGRLLVFGASSLRQVLPGIESGARFEFAGSDQLAAQIREGARADVFAAASPDYPLRLYRQGLVERPRVFATNRLVLVVPRANPGHVRTVLDVRRPGVKLVVGAPGVPVGAYTRRALARLGESDALRRVVSEEPDVKGVLAKVALGEADAGFVYASDAKAAAGKVRVIELPARAEPAVRYMVAVARRAAPASQATAFVRRLTGPAGRRALLRAGFGLP